MISSIGLNPTWDIYTIEIENDDNWGRGVGSRADYVVKLEEQDNNTILLYVAIPVHRKNETEVRRVLKWLDTHQSTLKKVKSASLYVEPEGS